MTCNNRINLIALKSNIMQKDDLKNDTSTDSNNVLGEGLCKYYIRFRNIPAEMMFTPSHLISVDHIQVYAKIDATEYDLKIAICRELENLNYRPDDIRIESSQPFA